MAIDVRITDVPFSEVPDHEAKVFINDGGKLRQTDLTTIAKYSKLYELIIGAHDTAMGEITQQLESGQLGMAEAFDSYMSQLNATHAHLDLALEELKGEIEDDMTQRAETMTAEYTAMRDEYTGLFSENTEALEETRKNIDAQIQAGTNDIAQQSQDVLAQLTGLFNNSTASLQNTKSELEAALNTKHLDIVDDLDAELAQHIETCNGIHASYKAEMEQIITNGQADIQRIIDNVGDLSEAVATLDSLKDDVEAIETELDSLREEMKDNAGLQEHLTASNPHGITKSDVGLSNVVNERQYSASNPQPSVQRVAFSAGASDSERPILVGSDSTNGQNVYSAPGITANYAKKTLTAPGGFKGNADSATTLVGLTASIDELNNLGKSVADGKALLATTISKYLHPAVASDATFEELSTGVNDACVARFQSGLTWGYEAGFTPNGTEVSGQYALGLGQVYDMKYFKGLFLAACNMGIAWSEDGKTWTTATGPASAIYLAYGGGTFVATGYDGIWWSADGKTWTKNKAAASTTMFYIEPIYVPSQNCWFATRVSDINRIWGILGKFTDIKTGTFTHLGGKPITNATGNKVGTFGAFNSWGLYFYNETFFSSINSYSENCAALIYSKDYGETWHHTNLTKVYKISQVIYGGGLYRAYGMDRSSGADVAKSWYSYDGLTWTEDSVYHSNFFYTNDMWFSSCPPTQVFQCSYDGINWIDTDGHFGAQDVVYSNGVYIGIVYGVTTLKYSLDGITWSLCKKMTGSGSFAWVSLKQNFALAQKGVIVYAGTSGYMRYSNAWLPRQDVV